MDWNITYLPEAVFDQYLRMSVLDSNLNQTTYLLRDCVLVTQYLCIMFTYLQNTMNNTTYLTEFL